MLNTDTYAKETGLTTARRLCRIFYHCYFQINPDVKYLIVIKKWRQSTFVAHTHSGLAARLRPDDRLTGIARGSRFNRCKIVAQRIGKHARQARAMIPVGNRSRLKQRASVPVRSTVRCSHAGLTVCGDAEDRPRKDNAPQVY